jgi:tetratricopeptide (TPR) repeat protein
MIRGMLRRVALPCLLALSLSACTLFKSPPPPGSAQPLPPPPPDAAAARPGTAAAPGPGEAPYTPPPRAFRLSSPTRALVAQSHQQSARGDYGQAAATLERALRIEPDNPLVWIELGRVRIGEKDGAQADAMGRKALSLATGDPSAQAASWHLIADSLRLRDRNPEAADADRRAQGLTAH